MPSPSFASPAPLQPHSYQSGHTTVSERAEFAETTESHAWRTVLLVHPGGFRGDDRYPVTLLRPISSDTGISSWNLNPINSDWNTAANWTPAAVPNGPQATADFGASDVTNVSISSNITVDGISFESGSSSYAITLPDQIQLTLSSAGITNMSGTAQAFSVSGSMFFQRGAHAGMDVVYTNNAGFLHFYNTATADSAMITNSGDDGINGSSATFFSDSSTAGEATIINKSASGSGLDGGSTFFQNNSNAGTANLTNLAGALTDFSDSSSAASATLIADGGSVRFGASSKGDTARVELVNLGELDLTTQEVALSIGSLEGDGYAFLGGNELSVGSDNLSTTFSGLISEGIGGVSGGSISKIGTGTFTMSGANSYTGDTAVNEGALVVSNTTGSATGTGSVAVNGGTLGGGGIISGAVTIGTGSGTGAILRPSFGTTKKVVLTIQSLLTFKSDAAYSFRLKSKNAEVIAKGVTIESGAQFSLTAPSRKLPAGKSATVISNTATTPISGTFANLPDGGTIISGSNTFQASYEGGDGNDLTLTVLP